MIKSHKKSLRLKNKRLLCELELTGHADAEQAVNLFQLQEKRRWGKKQFGELPAREDKERRESSLVSYVSRNLANQ